MQCRTGAPLSDEQLSAAADQTADASVMEHLHTCSICATRLRTLDHFDRRLAEQLARWDCPPPQQLADYHWGFVSHADARHIARHLEVCVRCTDEVETLRVFVDDDSPRTTTGTPTVAAPPSRSRLRELVAVFVPISRALAIRGNARAPMIAEVDDMMIVIDVQPAGSDRVELLGQVATDDLDRWVGALVEVRQQSMLQATGEVDDMASFHCGSLPAGTSELRITAPDGMSVVLPEVELQHS